MKIFIDAHSDFAPTALNDPILIIYLFENAYRMYTHIYSRSTFTINDILPRFRNVGRTFVELIPNDFLEKGRIFFLWDKQIR